MIQRLKSLSVNFFKLLYSASLGCQSQCRLSLGKGVVHHGKVASLSKASKSPSVWEFSRLVLNSCFFTSNSKKTKMLSKSLFCTTQNSFICYFEGLLHFFLIHLYLCLFIKVNFLNIFCCPDAFVVLQ